MVEGKSIYPIKFAACLSGVLISKFKTRKELYLRFNLCIRSLQNHRLLDSDLVNICLYCDALNLVSNFFYLLSLKDAQGGKII